MKSSQKLDRAIKKDRKVLSVAAQVYGGRLSKKTTEKAPLANTSCTSVHIVAELFPVPRERTCKFSAEWTAYVGRMYANRGVRP